MGRYDEALADYSRAIELDPEHRLGHRQPRPDLPVMGRYDDALADLNRAIELDPGTPGPSPAAARPTG